VRFVAALVVGLLFASPLAAQQQPSANEIATARELFRNGVAHAEGSRWPEALDAFQRAYALWPQPTVLFNLAGAQERTGHLVAASESYRRFLREATSGTAAQFRDEAETGLARVEPKIGRIRVLARDMEIDDQLVIDGAVVSRALIGTDMPIDPGAHVIAVRRGRTDLVHADVTIAEGEHRAEPIELVVPPRPALPPSNGTGTIGTTPGDGPDEPVDLSDRHPVESSSIFVSPWFWVITAAVIAGVVTSIVVLQPGEGPPYRGNFGPGHIEVP
jgi:hypothetical protein